MKRQQPGFTLIELLTALTVVAVLLAMAVPIFKEFTRNNRITASQNDLVTAFTLARSEALKLSTPVTVCASADGDSCMASGNTNWATGWIVFRDGTGAAGVRDVDDPLIQAWPSPNTDMILKGSDTFVQYTATGTISAIATQNFDIYATGCSGQKLRHVAVSPIGMLTATLSACP